MASLLSVHTFSLAAPNFLEKAKAAGVQPAPKKNVETPVCDKRRAAGQWNTAWDPFFELAPLWTEEFIAAGTPVYLGNVLSPRLAELLSVACDASHHPHVRAGHTPPAICRDQALRSKRSRFMTLFHAATKSRTNACRESLHA
jgi:hypothetical protein